VANKYGHDPRGDDAVEGDSTFASALTAGEISNVCTIQEFVGVLDAAAAANEVVVLKFMREGCAACASTKKQYTDTAKMYASKAKFFEVDYDAAKPFCKKCEVRFVPSAHIYRGSDFVSALPLGKNSWDAFAEQLQTELA